ncbi:hypothetical protein GCM10007981_04590 [Thermocladium modestius]|uniref:Uncharacterized protein n=1 Tax=Thermocladium modestius TaxID=62609 RepID=A0A830GUD6_9CREN|nr:hypothetical protein GCM10007981_04590 [Thermocladium modestius]
MLTTLATLVGDCETMVNGEYNPVKLAKVLKCIMEGKCRVIAVIRRGDVVVRLIEGDWCNT